jgi:hypothetical protein
MSLRLYNQQPPPTLCFGFCIDYSVYNSFTIVGLWDPNFVRLIIHLQFGCNLSCSCFCSSIHRQGLAFLVRSIVHHRLITRGDVVLRFRGSWRVVHKADRLVTRLYQSIVTRTFRKIGNSSSHQVVLELKVYHQVHIISPSFECFAFGPKVQCHTHLSCPRTFCAITFAYFGFRVYCVEFMS